MLWFMIDCACFAEMQIVDGTVELGYNIMKGTEYFMSL
jgi:hypothetical protein